MNLIFEYLSLKTIIVTLNDEEIKSTEYTMSS